MALRGKSERAAGEIRSIGMDRSIGSHPPSSARRRRAEGGGGERGATYVLYQLFWRVLSGDLGRHGGDILGHFRLLSTDESGATGATDAPSARGAPGAPGEPGDTDM